MMTFRSNRHALSFDAVTARFVACAASAFAAFVSFVPNFVYADEDIKVHPERALGTEDDPSASAIITPSFYYLPETCVADGEWRVEGKALCRRKGVIYDWVFNAHPMFIALEGLRHASKVLRTFGNRSNIIHPFRSIAADDAIPHLTGLYLPAFDGLKIVFDDIWVDSQGERKSRGRTIEHDGCFYKSDTGGAFDGKGYRRVDIYVGIEVNLREFMSDGRYSHLNKNLTGQWNHPNCSKVKWDF